MNLSALLPKVHFVHSVLAHQTERGIRWQRRASAYLPNVSQNAARKTARPGARARNPRLPGAIAHLSKESRTPAGLGAIGEHSDCGSRTPRVGCGGGHSLPAPADPHSGAGAARYSEANGRSRTDPAAASTGCRGSVRHRPGSCLVRMGRIRASLGRRITVINSERRARRPGRSPTLTPVMLVQHAQGRREMGTKGMLRHATRSRRRSWTSALS